MAILAWFGICRFKVQPATVTISWSYDYSADPPCSAARSTTCIDYFEIEDITRTPVLLRSVTNPPDASGLKDITITLRIGRTFGERTISVIAVAKDGSGNRVTSNPYAARVTVKIPSGGPHWCLFW